MHLQLDAMHNGVVTSFGTVQHTAGSRRVLGIDSFAYNWFGDHYGAGSMCMDPEVTDLMQPAFQEKVASHFRLWAMLSLALQQGAEFQVVPITLVRMPSRPEWSPAERYAGHKLIQRVTMQSLPDSFDDLLLMCRATNAVPKLALNPKI